MIVAVVLLFQFAYVDIGICNFGFLVLFFMFDDVVDVKIHLSIVVILEFLLDRGGSWLICW